MEEDLYGDHNNTEISLFLEQRLHPQSPYALLRAECFWRSTLHNPSEGYTPGGR